METTYDYQGQQDFLQESISGPVDYAGFWLRFAAYIIDAVIAYCAIFVMLLIFGLGGASMFNAEAFSGPAMIMLIFLYAGIFLYFPLMESSKLQATLGKKAVGIKVTDMDGNRISFGRALGRTFAKIISGIILYIGYIMAGFTEKKQGLHDMIANTLVVKG